MLPLAKESSLPLVYLYNKVIEKLKVDEHMRSQAPQAIHYIV